MLPTDPRLQELSPFQQLWILGQISKRKEEHDTKMFANVKLLCSFIDPERAKSAFTEGERSESDGFYDDIKAMDPNFDATQYEEILENM